MTSTVSPTPVRGEHGAGHGEVMAVGDEEEDDFEEAI